MDVKLKMVVNIASGKYSQWLCMRCGGTQRIKPGTKCPSCGNTDKKMLENSGVHNIICKKNLFNIKKGKSENFSFLFIKYYSKMLIAHPSFQPRFDLRNQK